MELIPAVLVIMGRVFLETFRSPLFLSLYLLLFFLVAWQYKRLQQLSGSITGMKNNLYLRSALQSTGFGLLGGMLGSILLVFLGVDLSNIGIGPLWLVAILLMLIHPRFLCFAYAAGIISLSYLLFGFPRVAIPQLIGLVAILHLVESFLIWINGALNPLPVYINKDSQVQGGFNLQCFWPIPLLALVAVGGYDPLAQDVLMPHWWPLLNDYGPFSTQSSYALFPVMAILGYGEMTSTRSPAQTIRRSAAHLFLFSLSLLVLAILSARWPILAPLAALFSPLGHELVIWMGMREESNRKPIYIKAAQGLGILHVWPGSPASHKGLRSGDVIMAVNGKNIEDTEDLQSALYKKGNLFEVDRQGEYLRIRLDTSSAQSAGFVPVPDIHVPCSLGVNEDSIFITVRRLWRRWKRG